MAASSGPDDKWHERHREVLRAAKLWSVEVQNLEDKLRVTEASEFMAAEGAAEARKMTARASFAYGALVEEIALARKKWAEAQSELDAMMARFDAWRTRSANVRQNVN